MKFCSEFGSLGDKANLLLCGMAPLRRYIGLEINILMRIYTLVKVKEAVTFGEEAGISEEDVLMVSGLPEGTVFRTTEIHSAEQKVGRMGNMTQRAHI